MSKTRTGAAKPRVRIEDRKALRRSLIGSRTNRLLNYATPLVEAYVAYVLHGPARYLFAALALFNLIGALYMWGPRAKRALYAKWIIGAEFQRRATALSLDALEPDAYVNAAGPMTDRERDVLLQGCSFTLMKVRELVGQVEEDLADAI